MTIEFTDHAKAQAARRGIDEGTVLAVTRDPEQTVPVRPGREIRQSRLPSRPTDRGYLVRVVVDVSDADVTIVTVYRTSKIDKYWMI